MSFIFRYFQITSDRLQHLVSLIKHKMQRLDTKVRISVRAKTHLAITLRYLNFAVVILVVSCWSNSKFNNIRNMRCCMQFFER